MLFVSGVSSFKPLVGSMFLFRRICRLLISLTYSYSHAFLLFHHLSLHKFFVHSFQSLSSFKHHDWIYFLSYNVGNFTFPVTLLTRQLLCSVSFSQAFFVSSLFFSLSGVIASQMGIHVAKYCLQVYHQYRSSPKDPINILPSLVWHSRIWYEVQQSSNA